MRDSATLGVSVMQFLLPWIITFGAFGQLGRLSPTRYAGERRDLVSVWVQNAALVWVPILAAVLVILAYLGMNNLPQHAVGRLPFAIGKYLWLTLLGFLGASVGWSSCSSPPGAPASRFLALKTFLVLVGAVCVHAARDAVPDAEARRRRT